MSVKEDKYCTRRCGGSRLRGVFKENLKKEEIRRKLNKLLLKKREKEREREASRSYMDE